MIDRPNILWIQSDEHRPDSLGCYGSPWAKTPFLDALARRGLVFANCVCNAPVCVPSRSSQLTARYPQEIGVVTNLVFEMDHVFPPDTVTFPEVLAQARYATASFGKWHTPNHPTWQQSRPLINLEQYASYFALDNRYDEAQHRVIKRPGGMPVILAGSYPVSHGHPSQVITDWAIDWLRELPAGKPFMLRVSHNWPHTPVVPPPPFDHLYAPDEIPIRYYDETAYRTRADYDRAIADGQRVRELSRAQVRQMWCDYMGLAACVDHEVGRVLSALHQLGLEENTIILFSADHGKALGEWGATEKGFYDSEVWRVPFILAGPGVASYGAVRTDPCELVDTGRTLLRLAGLTPPAHYRGRDLLSDPAPEAVYGQIGWPNATSALYRRASQATGPTGDIRGRDAIIWAQYQRPPAGPRRTGMRVAIRTERYRMDVTWWRDGHRTTMAEADGNLFDLREDPGETVNRWSLPTAQPVIAGLWRALEAWDAGLERPANLFSETSD